MHRNRDGCGYGRRQVLRATGGVRRCRSWVRSASGRAWTGRLRRHVGVTRRESEVLNAVVGRLSNAEIAARLFVSERTVESHVSALLRKLGATNRLDLVDRAQLLAGAAPASGEVGSLPTALDVFVGRRAELTQLVEMVRRRRLVTITGAGGVGKTRLAIEVGRLLMADVEGGVWFVDVMVARAPSDVAEQIAVALGVRVSQGQAIEDRLVEHLQGRRGACWWWTTASTSWARRRPRSSCCCRRVRGCGCWRRVVSR